MIQTEKRELYGTTYDYTYSDEGYYIERDGVIYVEAYDPEGSGRVYTETTERIPDWTPDPDEAEISDYQDALKELGVE